MKKIRIPRKLKKKSYSGYIYYFPCVTKLNKYLSYFRIEYGIKQFNMTPEKLCETFGKYTMDDVIWWNWVIYKKTNIITNMSKKYQEYWNYFKDRNIIK